MGKTARREGWSVAFGPSLGLEPSGGGGRGEGKSCGELKAASWKLETPE